MRVQWHGHGRHGNWKYLADQGHQVWIWGGTRDTFTDSGIHMVASNDYQCIPWKELDYFSPVFYFQYPEIGYALQWIDPSKTKLFLAHHCHISHDIVRTLLDRGFKVVSHYVSKFVERNAYDQGVVSKVIANGLHDIFLTPVDLSKKHRGRWVSCSIYERGGSLLRKIFKAVQQAIPIAAQELHFSSYMESDKKHFINSEPGIVFHGSIPKQHVVELLDSSEYFIYPQMLEGGRVTHDTYSSVILEAISRGVIVIAFDVAGLRENFGHHIVLIPTPPFPMYDPYAAMNRSVSRRISKSVRAPIPPYSFAFPPFCRDSALDRRWHLQSTVPHSQIAIKDLCLGTHMDHTWGKVALG